MVGIGDRYLGIIIYSISILCMIYHAMPTIDFLEPGKTVGLFWGERCFYVPCFHENSGKVTLLR